MDVFDHRYYAINKRMLWFLGQWPYQPTLERYVRTLILLILNGIFLAAEINHLRKSWGDTTEVISCISGPAAFALNITKLVNCFVNTTKIRSILEEIRFNWKNVESIPEMRILRKYGKGGMRCTVAYTTYMFVNASVWGSIPMISIAMDIVLPLNASRPRVPILHGDFILDPDEYFFEIYAYTTVMGFACLAITVTVDIFYMTTSQHVCGMFALLRYRLENITDCDDEKSSIKFNKFRREEIYFQRLVLCLKLHNRFIRFVRTVESSCEWSNFIIVCLITMMISSNAARIIDLVFFTLPGQWIIDSSSTVRDSAYACKWYLMSPRSRKLLVVLIQQSIQPCTITAGKLYVLSMESFCAVVRTAASYYTMLASL